MREASKQCLLTFMSYTHEAGSIPFIQSCWFPLIAQCEPYWLLFKALLYVSIDSTGAKLDAYLQHEGSPEESLHINRRHALLRYHWKMGPLQNIGVRLSLLRVSYTSH